MAPFVIGRIDITRRALEDEPDPLGPSACAVLPASVSRRSAVAIRFAFALVKLPVGLPSSFARACATSGLLPRTAFLVSSPQATTAAIANAMVPSPRQPIVLIALLLMKNPRRAGCAR